MESREKLQGSFLAIELVMEEEVVATLPFTFTGDDDGDIEGDVPATLPFSFTGDDDGDVDGDGNGMGDGNAEAEVA